MPCRSPSAGVAEVVDPPAFLRKLKQSRLLPDDLLAQVVRLAEEVAPQELPAALVKDGILTPY
jgi:hypothetical protein